jgi:hypothetical protein
MGQGVAFRERWEQGFLATEELKILKEKFKLLSPAL